MEEYLGDGLYAKFENGMIELCAPRGDGNHVVFLEPKVYYELVRFARQCGFPTPTKNVDIDGSTD